MKLFVISEEGVKEYLSVITSNRAQLKSRIGEYFTVKGEYYSIDDVHAEANEDNTTTAMAVGGALGLFGGIAGVLAGGIIGGLVGNSSKENDENAVKLFNESFV